MELNEFLTQLLLDLEDVQSDIEFDCGPQSVPGEKVRQIIWNVGRYQDEV